MSSISIGQRVRLRGSKMYIEHLVIDLVPRVDDCESMVYFRGSKRHDGSIHYGAVQNKRAKAFLAAVAEFL